MDIARQMFGKLVLYEAAVGNEIGVNSSNPKLSCTKKVNPLILLKDSVQGFLRLKE